MRLLLLLSAALTLAACTADSDAAEAVLRVDDAWARPADPARCTDRTAVYLTLRNDTDAPARLVHAEADTLGIAEIHRSTMQEGVMRMRPVGTVEIPSGEAVAFEPGGYHIMLTQLTQPLRPGTRFPLRLTLASGRVLTAEVSVREQ